MNETSSMKLSQSESELLSLAREGDSSAFSALFDQHKTRIYSLCLRLAGNPAEAEEWTQSAFLQVFRQLADSRLSTSFSVSIERAVLEIAVAQCRAKQIVTARELSIDHLVQLAGESVCSRRRPARFSQVRAKVRDAGLNFAANRSWISVVSTLGRARRAMKAMS